jgi:hypothetical protein
MSRFLTASDRSSLIRLASSLPAGSAERKAILAGLAGKTASDRMELFEEIEGQIARLRNQPDWKDVRAKIADALHILGRDEPRAEMEEAFDQMMIAQRALDKAIQQLRMW